ncbi:MAG: DUF1080 domain-containing protein [Bryobacterales bacterium]|nr:DUF1080 domain-containing protein [Bryobacterales bacterium]
MRVRPWFSACLLFAGAFLVASLASAQPQPPQGFTALFNGKDLKNFDIRNGTASYRVENFEIVGTTVDGSPNTFLTPKREYADFVLEFEVKTDVRLNSGVQIRSHEYPADTPSRIWNGREWIERVQKKGRFHGYQVEISNEKAANSGGIYDEARRGWLHQPTAENNPACATAFKDNQWNKYRVVAEGVRIQTFVNGVQCTDLIDPADLTGYIGFQVHQFKGDTPAEVRWRNVYIQDNGKHVWKPIWDGKTTKGWTHRGGSTFTIKDGAIHGKTNPDDRSVGVLIYDAPHKDIVSRLQFKIEEGNSGYFFQAKKDNLWGYEAEIDGTKGTGGLYEVGGRKWVTGPEDNALVKPGDWSDLAVAGLNGRVVIHLNGSKTVDLPDDPGVSREGHLAIQAHGRMDTSVWFRSIEVLEKVRP